MIKWLNFATDVTMGPPFSHGVSRLAGRIVTVLGRPISLDPELAGIISSKRWATHSSFPQVPSHLLSSHSWKKKSCLTNCSSTTTSSDGKPSPVGHCYSVSIYQQYFASPVDDPATSDSWSPIRRFAPVCLERNIKMSIRWIPSKFNSSERSSREHDNAYDSTKSLVDHFGSSDGRTIAVSHTRSDREPSCREDERRSRHLTGSLSTETSFPRPSVPWQ